MPEPRSDEDLLRDFVNGDQNAMAELFLRHRWIITRLLKNRIDPFGENDAEDYTQDAFIALMKSAPAFRVGCAFRPWLFTIALNCARDQMRKKKRRPESKFHGAFGKDAEDDFDAADPNPRISPGSGIETQEQIQKALKLLDQVPEPYLATLRLWFWGDLSYQQIADCLGVPIGTVKSRLHSGIRMINQAWTAAEISQSIDRRRRRKTRGRGERETRRKPQPLLSPRPRVSPSPCLRAKEDPCTPSSSAPVPRSPLSTAATSKGC